MTKPDRSPSPTASAEEEVHHQDRHAIMMVPSLNNNSASQRGQSTILDSLDPLFDSNDIARV
jgi:hypothetical protein